MAVACKALLGGTLVLMFALLAETLSPKRFAGVFAGAPSVALASLTMTVLFTGPLEARRECAGMAAGGLAFVVYCLVAPATMRRLGALRGSALALLVWLAGAAAMLPLSAASSAASAGALGWGVGSESRPRLRCEPGKIGQAKPRDALVRFAFGASTSLLAAVLALVAGPVIGGTLLAFPAILLASLTLVAGEEGQSAARDDARGAAAGGVGLVAFAVLGARFLDRASAPAALLAAAAGWVAVALGCYAVAWALGRGDDEAS